MEKRRKKNITSTNIKINYLGKEILGPMESEKTTLIIFDVYLYYRITPTIH